MILFIILFQLITIHKIDSSLLYPEMVNVGKFKPTSLNPLGSSCGLELQESLCDNRFQNNKFCSNTSSIIYCDQTCPYGTVLPNINKLKQLNLEMMEPCEIVKDYGVILTKSESTNSYLFDKNNNLCDNDKTKSVWRPFPLSLTADNSSSQSVINTGFSISLWFQQYISNNGTLIHIFRDDNTTLFKLSLKSSSQKIYLNYYCNLTKTFLCFMEIDTGTSFYSKNNTPNYMALKVYKKQLTLFINEPNSLNELPLFGTFDLEYDLGAVLISNSKLSNFYIAKDVEGSLKYYGWIQDLRVFLIPLTNAEILQLYGKVKYYLFIQPECRCPNDYPRNENENSIFCFTNIYDAFSSRNKLDRLNQYTHNIGYINDDDLKTTWISCISTNPITLNLDLQNGIYLLQRIEIFFSSMPPTNLLIQRYYNNKWIVIQNYSTACETSDEKCTQLPQQFGKEILGGYTIVWSSKSGLDDLSFYSDKNLLENSKATKLQFTLSGYYPEIRTDIRQLYYAINEIQVKASGKLSCDCNGYRSSCNINKLPNYECKCDDSTKTAGSQCNQCLPLYNDKLYQSRYINPNAVCSLCFCNDRADSCVYDLSLNRGYCQNCKNNTFGSSCNDCAANSYYNQISKSCSTCGCNLDGVFNQSAICDSTSGVCSCKPFVNGTYCDECKDGYFNLTRANSNGCSTCECNLSGTVTLPNNLSLCDKKTGKSMYVIGSKCDMCMDSMFNIDNGCRDYCNCDPYGSTSPVCDKKTSQCRCKPSVSGLRCSQCEPGFYNLTSYGCVSKCNCDPLGSKNSTFCDPLSGQCLCQVGYGGINCDICTNGYYRTSSQCKKCSCNINGIRDANNICNPTNGQCFCNEFSEGFGCDTCKVGYWGALSQNNVKCQKCDCDAFGTSPSSFKSGIGYVCDTLNSQCQCKVNRVGTRCESCTVGYFFLNLDNIDCFECNCDTIGSIPGSVCDKLTGECVCKISNGIGGTRCDICLPEYYDFNRVTGSCSPCGCNEAGSLRQECDQEEGKCFCKLFVTGTKCDICIPGTSNLDRRNPYGCSKSPSKQSPPQFKVLSSSSITITWDPPDYPNGIILYYLVFRNNTLVFNTTDKSFRDNNLSPFVVYSYIIQSFNVQGNTTSKPSFVTITFPSQPCCSFEYKIFNLKSNKLDLSWSKPERLNGINLVYIINVYRRIDINRDISFNNLIEQQNSSIILEHNKLIQTVTSTNFQYTIKNLSPYKQYILSIRACNLDFTQNYLCLNATATTDNSSVGVIFSKTFLQFFTSQDKPEFQLAPTVITLNSSFVIIGILKPLNPNGIVLLYEVLIRRFVNSTTNRTDTSQSLELACSIEEWFDPNDRSSAQYFNIPKICLINNLFANTLYSIGAISSTVVGRSEISKEIVFNTLEERPVCPLILTEAYARSNSIFLSWNPSINSSTNDPYWIRCIGGNIKNFTIYKFENNLFTRLYSGRNNSIELSNLNSSTEYQLKFELCNGVGCISDNKLIKIKTTDPPPSEWKSLLPSFKIINSSALYLDWSAYPPGNFSFRLERANASFAYPPSPLEQGIRLHGKNYFNFTSSRYFPEGYPFFGLKYFFKTKLDSSLVYYAASSFSQSELTAVQLYSGQPWLLSNTQSSISACSIFLSSITSTNSAKKYNDFKWYSMKTFRSNSFAYLKSENLINTHNSSDCVNQVITDVNSVYIGGIPLFLLRIANSKSVDEPYKEIQRNAFTGCLKNISTVLEISNSNSSSKASEIKFDFDKAETSPGEPMKTNVQNGCPINLESSNSTVQFLGFGYILASVSRAMSLIYQSETSLKIEMDLRTEYSQGILFFDYDFNTNQYFLVRLVEPNSLEIVYKSTIRFHDPLIEDPTIFSFIDFFVNKTFSLGDATTNGYWYNLRVDVSFVNKLLNIFINNTRIATVNVVDRQSVQQSEYEKIINLEFFVNFYLEPEFYFGGYRTAQSIRTLLTSLNRFPLKVRQNFIPLFNLFLSLDYQLYFSGCMKNIKINGFFINYNDILSNIEYINVRFDGCPNTSNKNLLSKLDIQNSTNKNGSRIETIYEGSSRFAVDKSFKSFTEYFYRVVASDSFNKTAVSDWFLIRTPEAEPNDFVDLKYLSTRILSGYQLSVRNMSNYCYYCDSSNRMNKIFNGIINMFVLIVKEFNIETNEFTELKNVTFYCETVCFRSLISPTNNVFSENIFTDDIDSNAEELFIETKPITKYSLAVKICTTGGCTMSDSLKVTTNEEAPTGVGAPTVKEKTSSSLRITWIPPKFSNGNVTGYILRLIDAVNSENVIYFGLNTEYLFANLKSFTTYTFSLEACNRIGCNRSPFISFITSEMAPLSVSVPTIVSVNSNTIILKWNRPSGDQLVDGALTNYILYISQSDLDGARISSIDCETTIQQIDNLIPGQEYRIILSACTNGGCTNSSELRISTVEILPVSSDIIINIVFKNSTILSLQWNKPKAPNGRITKYSLYMTNKLAYEGLSNNFTINNLNPNTYFIFHVIVCNSLGCSEQSKSTIISTNEAQPDGEIILEGNSAGSNTLQLKWYSNSVKPLIPNGNIQFSVYATGPFLIELNKVDTISYKKQNKSFIKNDTLNLFNTTIMNTRYGIIDKILPFSVYSLQINASNSKGFILSNKISLETFKSIPDLVVAPQIVNSRSNSLQVEWYDPILINSDDRIFYFLLDYRVKYVWNESGPILNPMYESRVFSVFASKTLTKTFTLTNLKPYTAFSLQVTAINSYGESKSDYSDDYYTREETPRFQDEPIIQNITSTTVLLTWPQPKIPNGIIKNYRLHSMKFTENDLLGKSLTITQNVTLKSNVYSYMFEYLEPFTYYLFDVESCNTQGCASSYTENTDIKNSKSFIRTKESIPEQFEKPLLESFNSYSIQINWNQPAKPNGVIKYYTLERLDFYPPLTIRIKNLDNPDFIKYRKYKFDADKSKNKFTDIEQLESCSVYSYRVIAYNEIGNTSTEYVNVTVKPSKPLIVTSPIVNIIDSYTARFEWSTPITYCRIKAYYLNFQSSYHNFRADVDNSSYAKQSVIINNFNPFTSYNVSLVACVDVYDDPCTTSILRSFRTPGTVPQNVTAPIARLISNRVVSIEWLEPTLKNGITFEYQLIRAMITESLVDITIHDNDFEDRSETIYIGKNRFYIDTSVFDNEVYKYKVIYGNEFGNSVGDWSNEILVSNFSDTPAFQVIDGIKTIFLLFSLKSNPQSPSAINLSWKTYSSNELLNLLKNLLEKSSEIGISHGNPMLLFSNTQIDNVTILIEELNGYNRTNLTYSFLLSNKSGSIAIDNKMITNLKSETVYSFKLNIHLSADITNQTSKSKQHFRFSSESTMASTLSAYEAFESSILIIEEETNRLIIEYRLTDLILNNYDLVEIKLTKRIDELNQTPLIDNRILRKSSGNLTYGPFDQNTIYSLYISACSTNTSIVSENSNSLLRENNCIKSYSIFYSITTLAPRNVSDMHLEIIDYKSFGLSWNNPIYPNDYRLLYEISRRETCNESLILSLNSCSSKYNPYNEMICCEGKYYERKQGYECCNNNYLATTSNNSICCGGIFQNKQTDYECCGGLYYIYIPPGQLCCSNTKEISEEITITIGYGDQCCSSLPYTTTSSQKCCNQNIVSTKFLSPFSKYAPLNEYQSESLFNDNTCVLSTWESVENKKCKKFETVYNETHLSIIDSSLSSFTSYDYSICARNTYDVTCNDRVFSAQTKITLPANFSYFNYKITNENEIILLWNDPIYINGPLVYYVLYRNEVEIYRGINLYFIDENYEIVQPYKLFRYEIKVCNTFGCTYNDKILYASTKEKMPENFDLPDFKVSSNSIQMLWKMPPAVNGVLKNFVINIQELDLELSVYFNFQTTKTSDIISVKNIRNSSEYIIYFSADAIYSRYSSFNLTFINLKPYTYYSIKLAGCNNFGCTTASGNFNKDKERYTKILTNEFQLFDLADPVIYVIDETEVELVWQEPRITNGPLFSFKIFRNNLFLIEFDLSRNLPNNLNYEMGFYSYIESNLIPDTFYSYRIYASNKNNSILSKEVYVETPSIGFIKQCNITENSNLKTNNSKYYSDLTLLNLVNFNFNVQSSSEILISYENVLWRKLITCISLFNYNNLKQVSLTETKNGYQSDDKSAFTIKILLQSNINGLQSIDFPYPDNLNLNSSTFYTISGLSPFTSYSIRIAFSTFYPNKQLLTTRPVFIQTFEKEPCCGIDMPTVIQFPFMKTFSIRFKYPSHPNGIINKFKITRVKLIGRGCELYDSNFPFEAIEETKELNLNLSSPMLLFDPTNSDLIYKDLDAYFMKNFAYFSYKVTLSNSIGSLESQWSTPLLNLQFSSPEAPLDPKINNIHSTGFRFKFKEPTEFNGILSHYTVNILAYYGSSFNYFESQAIIIDEVNKCKKNSEPELIEIPISGLQPFKTYRITVFATNQMGFSSNESEEVIVNTFEASPKTLTPFTAKPVINYDEYTGYGILFKFFDPINTNGILISFNLYEYNDTVDLVIKGDPGIFYNYQLNSLYSGLQREFFYANLKPFKNYYFIYELCTASGCTRQSKCKKVLTLEGAPEDQPEPAVNKVQSNLRCFNIEITEPLSPNGVMLFFEVYRIEKIHPLNPFENEKFIRNLTANSSLISFNDCDLKPNIIYSYRVISFNTKGNAVSNFSRPVFSSQLLPEEFSQILITQTDNSIVRIDWKRPESINGQIVSYNIYRNSELITNATFIQNFSTALELTYNDNYDFFPKTLYRYELYACNEAGCSTDKKKCIATITTNDQPPSNVVKPLLLQITARSAKITARNSVTLKSPTTQSVVQYSFYSNNSLIYEGPNFEISLEKLVPDTVYSISLLACTFLNASLGCKKASSDLLILTNQAPPEDLSPIQFVDYAFDDYFLNVHLKWKLPRYAFGFLNLVEIKRNGIEIFISKNTSIFTYIDSKLDYGKNYTYQLLYFNDAGSINTTSWHYTIQNFPKLIDKPQCAFKTSNEIHVSFNDPIFPNGEIQVYEVKYKMSNNMNWNKIPLIKKDLKSSKNTIKINNLRPDTQYEFQVGVCNGRGCTYSTVIGDETCRTVESLPEGLNAPECSDIFDINPIKISLLIRWYRPAQPNGAVIDYTLYRSTFKKSISFDLESKFNTNKVISRMILYVGMNLSFIDYTVEAFSTYDYLLEVKTKAGSLISPITRFTTRSILPMFLTKVGTVDFIKNDSISLSLYPPIYLNGQLNQVFVILIQPNFIKEILVYPRLASSIKEVTVELSSNELLSFLNNFKVINLKPNNTYEIKSKFCNSVGCLTSTESLLVQTLGNDQIIEFIAMILSPNKVKFNWKFSFGVTKSTTPIEYRIRILSQNKKIDQVIYFGSLNTFQYDNLQAAKSYAFELAVINDLTNIMLDTKIIEILTPLQKPLYNEMYSIDLISLNQTLSNKSSLIKLDWANAFLLNGPLTLYSLAINNQTIYNGLDTSIVTSIKFDECTYKKFIDNYGAVIHGYFNILNIELVVNTIYTNKTSQIIQKSLNCTIDLKPFKGFKTTMIYYQPWFVFTLFCGGLLGLIIIIIISVYFSSRSKINKEKEIEKLNPIQNNSIWNEQSITDLEREHDNLRDLLKLHDILDGKDPSDEYSLGNEKIDYEKARMLKELINFKNRELPDIFERDLRNFNQKVYSPKLNSSALSARSISDNGEFICRVTAPSDRDSFDELFDPIVDSHI